MAFVWVWHSGCYYKGSGFRPKHRTPTYLFDAKKNSAMQIGITCEPIVIG